eukprot:12903608-Prorocentrum_lima.AAC.1
MCCVQVLAISLAASSAIPMYVLLCVGVEAFVSCKLAGVCGGQPPVASYPLPLKSAGLFVLKRVALL